MGLGSAIMTPVAMAILPVIFPPKERGRAISIMAAAMGVGVPLGPIVGGWLLDHFWWGSIFLVNVPVAVIGHDRRGRCSSRSRATLGRARSTCSAACCRRPGLVAVVYGVIEAPRRGWGDSRVLVALGRRAGAAGRVRDLGAAVPVPDDRSWSVPAGRGSCGAPSPPRSPRSGCSGCCSRCRSTCRRCRGTTRSTPDCGCCR